VLFRSERREKGKGRAELLAMGLLLKMKKKK
jgi:hypothetical protein